MPNQSHPSYIEGFLYCIIKMDVLVEEFLFTIPYTVEQTLKKMLSRCNKKNKNKKMRGVKKNQVRRSSVDRLFFFLLTRLNEIDSGALFFHHHTLGTFQLKKSVSSPSSSFFPVNPLVRQADVIRTPRRS